MGQRRLKGLNPSFSVGTCGSKQSDFFELFSSFRSAINPRHELFVVARSGHGTIFTLTDDRATGEAYCLAHHVTVEGGKRRLMLASLRYLDTFVKIDGVWLFAERLLYVDWMEERPIS